MHINHVRLQGDHNNNKMESLNGSIRDREKTIRSLEKDNTPKLKGYQIYNNYIREHQGQRQNTVPEARHSHRGRQQMENADRERK